MAMAGMLGGPSQKLGLRHLAVPPKKVLLSNPTIQPRCLAWQHSPVSLLQIWVAKWPDILCRQKLPLCINFSHRQFSFFSPFSPLCCPSNFFFACRDIESELRATIPKT
jgi:hypothetical protein